MQDHFELYDKALAVWHDAFHSFKIYGILCGVCFSLHFTVTKGQQVFIVCFSVKLIEGQGGIMNCFSFKKSSKHQILACQDSSNACVFCEPRMHNNGRHFYLESFK